jgi:hypothetical protein
MVPVDHELAEWTPATRAVAYGSVALATFSVARNMLFIQA